MADINDILEALRSIGSGKLLQAAEELKELNKQYEIFGERVVSVKEQNATFLQVQAEASREMQKMLLASIEARDKEAAQVANQIKALKTRAARTGETHDLEIQALEDRKKLLQDINGLTDDQIEKGAKVLKVEEEHYDAMQQTADANEEIGENTAEFLGAITGIDDSWKKTLVGGLIDAASRSGDLVGALDEVGEKLSEQFKPANLLGSTYMKLQETLAAWIVLTVNFAFEQDEMISKIRQATAGSKEFDDVVVSSQLNVRTLGVDTEAMGASFASLHQNMAEFTNLTKEGQGELLEFTALMGEMGVSSDVTAGNLQVLTKSLGLSVGEATAATREMAGAAKAIGMPLDEMMSGFKEASPVLAKYGKDAPAIFKKVAAASKATGVSISGLLAITEKMDTFEGAAETAGRLNALLGGTVNALDLLNASEEERIGILIRSVEASGKNWDAMNKFERQAIASAAGITDMAEAAQIFRQSSSAYDEMLAKTEATALSQEELEEATRAQMSVSKKWGVLIDSFAVSMRPLMEGLSQFLDFILKIRKEMGTGFNVVMYVALGILLAMAAAVGTLIGLFIIYKVLVAVLTAGQFLMALASGGVAAGLGAIGVGGQAAAPALLETAAGVGAVSAAADVGLGLFQLLALAIAAAAIAVAAIALAIAGLVFLVPVLVVALFKLVEIAWQLPGAMLAIGIALIPITIALAGFIIVMSQLAPLAVVASVGLIAIGGGMLVLGVGVLAMAIALKFFNEEVRELPTTIGILFLLTPAIAILLIAFALLAPAMMIVGYALLPLSLGIAALGIGLALIRKNIKTLAKFADALWDLKYALVAMLYVGTVFAPHMIIMGIAMMPLGIALALMGVGLLLMGVGLKKVRKEAQGLGELGMQLGIFASALKFFGAGPMAMIFMGIGLAALGIGLLVVAAGIKALGKAMKKLGTEGVFALAMMLTALAAGLALLGNPLAMLGAGVLVTLGVSGFPEMMESVSKLTPGKVKAAGQVVASAAKYAKVQASFKDPGDDSFIALMTEIKELLKVKSGGKGGKGSGKQTIVLKIGERAFAKAVVNALEEHNALNIG